MISSKFNSDVKLNNNKQYNNLNVNLIKPINIYKVDDIDIIDYNLMPLEDEQNNEEPENQNTFSSIYSLFMPDFVGRHEEKVCATIANNLFSIIDKLTVDKEKPKISEEKKLEEKKDLYIKDFTSYASNFLNGKRNPLNAHTNWCLMFVSHCIQSNGSFESIKGFNLDEYSCSAQVKYINENNPEALHLSPANYNNVTSLDYIPKNGDIFFIENNGYDRGAYVVQHVGIVNEVEKDENGNVLSITTIEGNVNSSSYYSSVVAEKTYTVDDKGRYCLQSGDYVSDDCVIYGFFDTASSINIEN